MNPIPEKSRFFHSRSARGLFLRAALAVLAAGALVAHRAHGQSINVPNNSFENPVVPPPAEDPEDVIPGAPTSWTQTAQPGYYVPSEFGNVPWNQTVGVFANTTPFITNLNGNQAAYILNFEGNGIYQSLAATYTAGTPYTMTVGVIAGSGVQPTDSLDLMFYYENGGNMITLGDTSITSAESNDLTSLQYFNVAIPAVQATDPEAGQPIGIAIVSTNGIDGGFWDADNVQVVPEPATFGLLVFGLGALAVRRRRAAC